MAAPIINREILGPDVDATHSIPSLNTVDLIAANASGAGLVLAINPTGPLDGDARTQTRLAEKIGAYLHYLDSPEFKAEFGERPAQGTRIVVRAHQGCAPEVRSLLKLCSKWAGESGVALVLEIPEK